MFKKAMFLLNNRQVLTHMSMGWWFCRKKMKETIHDMEMSYGTTGSLFRYRYMVGEESTYPFVIDVGNDTGCNQDCADPHYFWKLDPDPH
jgi:hypothetical protein